MKYPALGRELKPPGRSIILTRPSRFVRWHLLHASGAPEVGRLAVLLAVVAVDAGRHQRQRVVAASREDRCRPSTCGSGRGRCGCPGMGLVVELDVRLGQHDQRAGGSRALLVSVKSAPGSRSGWNPGGVSTSSREGRSVSFLRAAAAWSWQSRHTTSLKRFLSFPRRLKADVVACGTRCASPARHAWRARSCSGIVWSGKNELELGVCFRL